MPRCVRVLVAVLAAATLLSGAAVRADDGLSVYVQEEKLEAGTAEGKAGTARAASPRATAGHVSATFNGISAASGGGAKVCFDLSSSAACDPAASACCAANSPTPNAARIVELQLKPDAAAIAQCLTGADKLKSFKALVWTLDGAKVAAKYVKAAKVLSVKRKWLGAAKLCVDIPAASASANPCAAGSAGLEKLCGAGGCQLTAVTTKFDQAGDASPAKKSCKLSLTVPLTAGGQQAPSAPDVNECTAGANPCGSNSVCTNTDGSFLCTCSAGYASPTGDGKGCTDVNECAAATNPCGANSTCTNTDGGFTCACDPGFTSFAGDGRGCYTDVCAANGSPCLAANTACKVNGASAACGCQDGYYSATGVDGVQCVAYGCTSNPCGANSTCTNTQGSGYTCACNPGYGSPTRDGKNCGRCAKAYETYYTSNGPNSTVGWQCAASGGNICASAAYGSISSYSFTDAFSPGVPITSLKVEVDGRVCTTSGVRMRINGVDFGDLISGASCSVCAANPDCTTKTWATTDPAALAAYVPGGSNLLEWRMSDGSSVSISRVNLRVTVTRGDTACDDCRGIRGGALSCGTGGVCSAAANGCTCNAGWVSANDNATCADVNECSTGATTCSAGLTCTNFPGTSACSCPTGLLPDLSGAPGCLNTRQQVALGTCSLQWTTPGDECVSSAIVLGGAGFTLFGYPFPSFRVSSNGYLNFDVAVTSTSFNNPTLPSADARFRAIVAPFFEDLVVDASARVFIQPAIWSGAGATVVEWYNAYFFGQSGTRVTFQVWLFYDGRIGFRYLSTNNLASARAKGSEATAGMQLAAPYSSPTKYFQVFANTVDSVAYGASALASRLFVPSGDTYVEVAWAGAPTQPLGP